MIWIGIIWLACAGAFLELVMRAPLIEDGPAILTFSPDT